MKGLTRLLLLPFLVLTFLATQALAATDRAPVTHVFGKDDSSLWRNYDWPKALKTGSEWSGIPFSGESAQKTQHPGYRDY